MRSSSVKIAIFVLIVGLLTACGSQTTEAPASTPPPTEVTAPTISSPLETKAPTNPPLPTDTAAPTEPAAATESAAATQPAGQSPQGAQVSFAHDVFPIIDSRCINCHGGQRVEKSLNLNTYADMMAGSENGPVVTAGNAADSLLVELITNQKMPKRGPKLTPPQVQLITEWVNQGALNN